MVCDMSKTNGTLLLTAHKQAKHNQACISPAKNVKDAGCHIPHYARAFVRFADVVIPAAEVHLSLYQYHRASTAAAVDLPTHSMK